MPSEVAAHISELEAELWNVRENFGKKPDDGALQQAEIDLLFRLGSDYMVLGANSNARNCFEEIIKKRPLKPIREMSPTEDTTQIFALLALYDIDPKKYHADAVAVGLYSK